ncbi:MAG: hypothetical protein JRN20_15205 [Nitrososphaerota archaeon]|nr:hypothetical protein [Nitrososphaerota archaeon]
MLSSRLKKGRRQGIAGIIAAVVLFAMLFTVGLVYFLNVNSGNQLFSLSFNQRATNLQNKQSENLAVSVFLDSTGYIEASVKDTGVTTVSVVGLYVVNQNNAMTYCDFSGSAGYVNAAACPSQPDKPIVLVPGQTSQTYSTGVGCNLELGPSCSVKALTSQGNIFIGYYPPYNASLPPVITAIAEGAFGDLFLQFKTYKWYSVIPCTTSSSGYCLSNPLPGFQIPAASAQSPMAFSVTVTNLSPEKLTITLDYETSIYQFFAQGSSFRTAGWYILSNSSDTNIDKTYSEVSIAYDQNLTLLFGNGETNQGTPQQYFTPQGLGGSNGVQAGQIASVFIFAHGWEGVKPGSIKSTNYGQNIPFVTTLYT